jgi:hypothetical protein
MKQWLLKWLLKDVTRFEVINHENSNYELGRIIVHKKNDPKSYIDKYQILSSLQDDNKTLKIFI